MDTFHNLVPGDVVAYRYRDMIKTGPVLRYLAFADHVVVGNVIGTGAVVDSRNFVRLARRARRVKPAVQP